MDIVQERKMDQRKKEHDFIKETVNSYLDSDRELRPKEEKLVKQAVKKCNWYLSGLIALCLFILTGSGIMLIRTTKQDIIEDIRETATVESMKISREIYNKLEKDYALLSEKVRGEMSKELEDNVESVKNETSDLKNFVMASLTELHQKSFALLGDTLKGRAKMENLNEDFEETKKEFKELKEEMVNYITAGEQTKENFQRIITDIENKNRTVNKYSSFFNLLDEANIEQLMVQTDDENQQKYFHLGELLIVWGQGKAPKKGDGSRWTEIKFCKKFANPENIGLSLTPKAKDGYAVVKEVSDQGFSCTVMKGEFTQSDCYWNQKFRYFAIGQAASES
jgi:hypothetical protein